MSSAPFPFPRYPGNYGDSDKRSSLIERLQHSGIEASQPPKPRPFDMSEPFYQGGMWCFWLTADEEVLRYVSTLNCILTTSSSPLMRSMRGRRMFSINPRYNYEETWMWLYRTLELETEHIHLGDLWTDVLSDSFEEELSDSENDW